MSDITDYFLADSAQGLPPRTTTTSTGHQANGYLPATFLIYSSDVQCYWQVVCMLWKFVLASRISCKPGLRRCRPLRCTPLVARAFVCTCTIYARSPASRDYTGGV